MRKSTYLRYRRLLLLAEALFKIILLIYVIIKITKGF